MRASRATAVWEGKLRDGAGRFKAGGGAFGGAYSFGTRFGEDSGTNPEELIAAAHAACFSMALAADLEKAGTPSTRIETDATCTLDFIEGVPTIVRMELVVRGTVPELDQAGFAQAAEGAKKGCPVSRALKGIADVRVEARLG